MPHARYPPEALGAPHSLQPPPPPAQRSRSVGSGHAAPRHGSVPMRDGDPTPQQPSLPPHCSRRSTMDGSRPHGSPSGSLCWGRGRAVPPVPAVPCGGQGAWAAESPAGGQRRLLQPEPLKCNPPPPTAHLAGVWPRHKWRPRSEQGIPGGCGSWGWRDPLTPAGPWHWHSRLHVCVPLHTRVAALAVSWCVREPSMHTWTQLHTPAHACTQLCPHARLRGACWGGCAHTDTRGWEQWRHVQGPACP